MSSGHQGNSTVAGSDGRARPSLAVVLVISMLFSAVPLFSTPASSDPWYGDDGDMTRDVYWNFTDPSDYTMANASVSGGFGTLEFINSTVGEHSTADYLLGNGSNVDLNATPDTIVIDNTSLPIQTLVLQPGPEGTDNYMDEWFPNWSPPDGGDLILNHEFDGTYGGSKRCVIIMKFNLSAVPAGAVVTEASLLMYEKGGRPIPVEYHIRAPNKTWAETGVSWAARDLIHYWDTAGGEFSTESFAHGFIEDRVGWHTLDLTRLVDLWTRNATPNLGFAIVPIPVPGDATKTFSDCEITNKPEQRPKLSINYTMGVQTGSYESRALGDAMNSTYTLATWSAGMHSKATDEFNSSNLSQRWQWMSDPRVTGGLLDFGTPGWVNITGSLSSNLSSDFNYLYQNITGDFRFDTSLREHFAADAMGAGLMLRNDAQTWLAIYKTGLGGAGRIVAEVARSGMNTTLASIPWPDSYAFLRMERVGSTYSVRASQDGLVWTLVATLAPQFDFTKRVSLGLCMFSEDGTNRPVVEFDFARIEPQGQTMNIEVRARTGNSTVLTDPSWTAWSSPLVPSSGASIGSPGRYIQYQAVMNTSYDWLSPGLSEFECHYERYAQTGTIITGEVSPPAIAEWQTLVANHTSTNGRVEYSYSIDHGSAWVDLGAGNVFDLSLSQPSIMIKIKLTTYDTISTPSVDTVDLVYLITHIGFYVIAPQTVIAGALFSVYIEPKDTGNNTAAWAGAVTMNARDASGLSNASSELYVTSDTVPPGSQLTVPNERYDIAETIRIVVSGGGATGISNPIMVVPGPVDHLQLEPNVTRLPEDNSSVFVATGWDALGNQITGSPITWHADASLGFLNSTTGPSVMLTTAAFVSGGYLNITLQGMTLSRFIEVAPLQMPPEIDAILPTQTKVEDFGSWTLDLTPYVSDREDNVSELKWYIMNNSIVSVSGENRTGDMTITFTTIQNLNGVEVLEVRLVDTARMMARGSLTVNITPINDAPTIDPIDPLVVRFADPYSFDLRYYVHDVETSSDDLTISVDAASEPYVSVEDLWLTFIYPESMNGTQQTVLVTASDGEKQSQTYIVVGVSDDYAPRTRGSLPNLEMYQGEVVLSYFDLDDYFSDPDGDLIIYTYGNTHVSVLIHQNNTVDFYAPSSWYGDEYVVFRANDSDGARAESAMIATVIAVNQPPVISGVPDIVVRYGDEYEFDLSPYVDDLDDDRSELTVMTNDPHVWAEGLLLTILYPAGMTGLKFPVNITVSDSELSDFWVMNVTVSTDNPPVVVIAPPDFSFDEDAPMPYPESGHITDFFADPDGDPLVFYAFVSTPNMTATAEGSGSNWTVTFAPEQDWNGLTYLTLRAMDGAGALAEMTVMLTVVSVPDRPILSLPASFTVTEGAHTILDITKNVADPDSVLADFRFVVAAEYASYASIHNGVVVFDFPKGYLGEDEESREISITITVFDQNNLFSSDTLTVTIIRVADATPSTNPLLWIALLGTAAAASIFAVFAAMRRKKPFVVRDMMLIHNDGFLITRQAKPVPGEIDDQVLSGMLTAVLNFVEDSMAKNHGSLTTFGFQEYQVMVQRGEHVFAAVVFEGDQPDGIDKNLGEFIKKFDRIYHKKLINWTGDIETDFAGADVLIQSWVRDHGKKIKEKHAADPWMSTSEKKPEEKMAK
jgi:regulation of enolase protein 1 (concanavalin A-like superfamily)